MNDFIAGNRENWKWRMMIAVPDWIEPSIFDAGIAKASDKLGEAPDTLRLESFSEGQCAQILHIGPYRAEAPTIARLHEEFLPEHDLVPTGHHHEIYLSDPRRVAPEKLKTILRQPVERRAN